MTALSINALKDLTKPAFLGDASLYVDFENDVYYWDHTVRPSTDLTDNGDGSYQITNSAWWSTDLSLLMEHTTASDGSGTYFSWTNAAGQRFEIDPTPANRRHASITASAGTTGFPAWNWGAIPGKNRRRISTSLSTGRAPFMAIDDYAPSQAAFSPSAAFTAPTRTAFMRRALTNNNVLANSVLHKIIAIPTAFAQAGLRNFNRGFGAGYPIHFIGDSYLNSHVTEEGVLDLIDESTYYPISQDGVGGSTLAEQAARFALTPEFWDATLVIVHGFEGSPTEGLEAVQEMVGRLSHDRWLLCQSNFVFPIGDPQRTPVAEFDTLAAAYAGDNYVEMFSVFAANGDESPEDDDAIADGLWPPSLLSDAVHANEAGQLLYSSEIYAKLVSNGFL